MFRKIVDTLKEVFWIKPSRKRSKPARRKTAKKTAVKKKPVKKAPKKPLKLKGAVPLKSRGRPAPGKPPVKAGARPVDPALTQAGVITHYFDRIRVCVVQVTHGTILIGDKLTVLGNKTKFIQKVWSMQIEDQDVKVAKKGQLIGLKVDKPVAVGDKAYK
ncbi:MAG: hypothetical protein KGJ09_06825 [Candidatus Omnitrophica bacterium]|nr:hypothetical protein [Candidatus Omnitrophota bacterium]